MKRLAYHYRNAFQARHAYVAMMILAMCSCSPQDSLLRQKIDGILEMDDSNSWWVREDEDVYLEGDFFFINDTVSLPSIHRLSDTCFRVSIDASNPRFEDDAETQEKIRAHAELSQKRNQYSEGRWSILSTKPDSIFINAPNHPLHGKYAASFSIDREEETAIGNCPHIHKIRLDNDSTHIVCSKVELLIWNPNLYKHWTSN